MNSMDGQSDIRGGERRGQFVVSSIEEHEYEENKKAADACPVKIIRLEK